MSRGKGAICYVVVIRRNGYALYLKREEGGEINDMGEVLKEARGVFTPSLLDAIKFLDETRAEVSASAYSGAVVEAIKEREVLK